VKPWGEQLARGIVGRVPPAGRQAADKVPAVGEAPVAGRVLAEAADTLWVQGSWAAVDFVTAVLAPLAGAGLVPASVGVLAMDLELQSVAGSDPL